MELDETVLSACMERCIALARRAPVAIGRPLVGAMIAAEDGKIVGEGYKQLVEGTRFVQHAERIALDQADEKTRGSYLFTTLEPCVEKESKPHAFCSCSRLIVDRGIRAVIVGLLDNSPSMKPGSGISYLEARGVNVILYNAYEAIITTELMPSLYKRPKLL